MLSLLKFALFLFLTTSFGFISLSQIIKIRSLILLIPLSISFGLGAYVFFTHVLAFVIGPQLASIATLIVFLIASVFIKFLYKKNSVKIEVEANKLQLFSSLAIAVAICILTFMAVSKFGTFDRESRMPIALTIFHNNVYPPKDCFRPDYVLLYHYGGEFLAGAVKYITNLKISTTYEMICVLLSGTTFLSLIALAWLLTRNFGLSIIGGFCAYFGGGLLWLDAIFRHLTHSLPPGTQDWSFFQTFINLGIHGGANNAPSVLTFIPTFNLGNPLLICSLILLWKMVEEKNAKQSISYILFLSIILFTLFLTADWLYATFWGAVMPFLIILWISKKKQFIVPVLVLLLVSLFLSKSIGNALFLQDATQNLGRTNIFDIGIKEKLFTVVRWGRFAHIMNHETISCFSWEFICELGLSLFLFPIAILYALKTKNKLSYLLLLSAFMTMPTPALLDFRMNPVELVRLFAFGNTMLIMLITCGVGVLYKPFGTKPYLFIPYIIVFCLSPISQLIVGALFSPHAYSNKSLVRSIKENLNNAHSLGEKISYLSALNKSFIATKNKVFNAYKEEIKFIKNHANKKDVALSSDYRIPAYAGVYTFIPARKLIYWDQLYSSFNTLHETLFKTLDLNLFKELNVKWVLIDKALKGLLPQTVQDKLNNQEIFQLAYTSSNNIEIYKLLETNKSFPKETGWILINKYGNPISSGNPQENKIILFSTKEDALKHLKGLIEVNPLFKKDLITAQAIAIADIEKQIQEKGLAIKLERRF